MNESLVNKVRAMSENNAIIAENQQKVYDKGYSDGYSDMDLQFWKMITRGGNRDDFEKAFYKSWFPKDYSFAQEVKPTTKAGQMFYNMSSTLALPKNVNLSELPISSSQNSANPLYALCAWCTSLQYFHDMGIQAQKHYISTWSYCRKLVTIEIVRVTKATTYNINIAIGTAFQECNALENITFEGEIGQNLDIHWSTKLTHDSLMNIIGCLYDFVSNGETITRTLNIGSTNLAKLTDEEKAIATQKGWTLA